MYIVPIHYQKSNGQCVVSIVVIFAMEEEKKQLIKKMVENGSDREDIRRELISQGLNTKDFETEYATLVKETPVIPSEPKQKRTSTEGRILGDFESLSSRALRDNAPAITLRAMLFYTLSFVLVFGIALYAWTQGNVLMTFFGIDGSDIQRIEQSLNVKDRLLQGKVTATASSAKVQGKRLLSYQGVCGDIAVVKPVVCKQVGESFVVFAQLSDGTYYCVDSNGFSGVVNRIASTEMCQ